MVNKALKNAVSTTGLNFIKRFLPGILLFLASFEARSQFYNLPGDYFFSLTTEKKTAQKDSSVHGGIKPYIHFFSKKYVYEADSQPVFKYITNDPGVDVVFYKHLIRVEPRDQKFKLRLDPMLNFELGKDVSTSSNKNLYTNTRGFIGSGYIGEQFYFETLLAENQSMFPDYISAQANSTGIVPGQGRWKTFKNTGYDYAFSSGFISIQPIKNFNIQAGHGKQKIGHGYRSLLLSDNSFNYPYARFTQQWFKGRVQYSNIYAVLMNLVPAAKIQTPNTERLFQKKPAAFQYLSINLSPRINIGFFQGVIRQSGDQRNMHSMSVEYINPLIYSHLVTYGLNHTNNVLAGGDVKIKLTDRFNMYGQLMLDNNNNDSLGVGQGFQAGINWFDVFNITNFFFQAEFNSTTRSSYNKPRTSATDQSYSHYNQNLAFTPGNGQEFIMILDYKRKRFFGNLKYNYQTTITGNSQFAYTSIVNARVGFLINPAYNLNISAGVNSRTQNFSNFKALNNETNYIYLSLRTGIYNLYYDF